MHHFGGIDNNQLEPGIVEGLIHFLDAHNELVQLFRTARDKCRELNIPEFKIRLYNAEGARGYELPTLNTLGAMVFENVIAKNWYYSFIFEIAVIKVVLVKFSKEGAHSEELIMKIFFEDYYSEDQYDVSIKEDTAYPCLHSPKTTEE
ncbi:hypothetical protein Tco_1020536 [Tanacetum coccineum]